MKEGWGQWWTRGLEGGERKEKKRREENRKETSGQLIMDHEKSCPIATQT